jgi:hypothetical protein
MKKQAATSSSTALVVSTVVTLEALKAELAGLQTIASTPYKTGDSVINGVNLSTETSVENIIKAVGSALAQEQVYNNAQSVLGVEKAKAFNIGGHSTKVIVETGKLRIQVLQIEDRRKLLEGLVAKGQEFVTKEDKYSMYLQELSAAGISL